MFVRITYMHMRMFGWGNTRVNMSNSCPCQIYATNEDTPPKFTYTWNVYISNICQTYHHMSDMRII